METEEADKRIDETANEPPTWSTEAQSLIIKELEEPPSSTTDRLTPEKTSDLLEARQNWLDVAKQYNHEATRDMCSVVQRKADTAIKVVKAIDMQLRSGEYHCSCCLLPEHKLRPPNNHI